MPGCDNIRKIRAKRGHATGTGKKKSPGTLVFPRLSHSLSKWSRGELNPGPVTVPAVFYVRSLLAVMAIYLPLR